MIVIPMAGMSSRFFNAGYDKPKYMLEARGKTLFEHSVLSFSKYFEHETFIFIVKEAFNTVEFVKHHANTLRVKNFKIIVINDDTRGQAETVAIGIEKLKSTGVDSNEPLTIFNIDTIRPNFIFPEVASLKEEGGYLEVFKGEGDNWSFAKPKNELSNRVIETSEKRPISNLCSTGLYYFSSIELFNVAFSAYINQPQSEWEKGELYVAPLYNMLISLGVSIFYHEIDKSEVIFCGVPSEYTEFINSIV